MTVSASIATSRVEYHHQFGQTTVLLPSSLPPPVRSFVYTLGAEKDLLGQMTQSGTSRVSHVSIRQKKIRVCYVLLKSNPHPNIINLFSRDWTLARKMVDGVPGLSVCAEPCSISPGVSFFISLETRRHCCCCCGSVSVK